MTNLEVLRYVNTHLGANTYILKCIDYLECIVIDPAESSISWVVSEVVHAKLRISYVALTHEHYDHVGGLPNLSELCECQVIASKSCSSAIGNPTLNFSRYLVNKDVTCGTVDLTCEDLDWALEWCGVTLRFLATPGHSPGSICLSAKGMLFTGDCLLPGGRRVTRIPGGDSGALEKSLRMLATNFDEETLVYPGHGEPFKLKEANLRRA